MGALPRSNRQARQHYARPRLADHRLCTICAVKPEDTSNLLAAFALGVSALALIVSGFMARRQNRLQGRLTAIEEERRGEEVEARRHARVTLGIPQPQIGKGDLVLTNEGPAGAWAVTFGVSSAVEGKQPPFISGLDQLPRRPPARAIDALRYGCGPRRCGADQRSSPLDRRCWRAGGHLHAADSVGNQTASDAESRPGPGSQSRCRACRCRGAVVVVHRCLLVVVCWWWWLLHWCWVLGRLCGWADQVTGAR